MTIEDRKLLLGKVFSPTAPIKEESFFRGRINQIERIVEVMNEEGQHALLFGERGVGKTSMANITCKRITNLYSVKVTCNSSDSFKTLWTRALSQVQFTQTTQGIGFKDQVKKQLVSLGESLFSKEEILPHDIHLTLGQFPDNKFLFVFDEFDNIKDQNARVKFADLIKSLSDNSSMIKIMIVGIADNVINLIGNHQSLERCLMQIKMPRMSEQELREIITKGFEQLEIKITNQAINKILNFSSGFPHYTHLLCKYSIKNALEKNSLNVKSEELNLAINQAIENASEQLRDSYSKAIISSSQNSQWKPVLRACATCKSDEFDSFSTTDILNEFNKITGKNSIRENITHNLGKLCQEVRGLVLEKIGNGKNIRYRFYNPMMKPFVLLSIEKEQLVLKS
jgi:Cdc6-like AAA superfamily ATPase